MAAHDDLPGIEVSVCMNGEKTKEYYAESKINQHDRKVALHQTAWSVTKFIESIEESGFSVKVDIKKPYKLDCDALSFELEVC